MPRNDTIPGSPEDWLTRAKSSLSLSKIEKPDDVFYEDLCFHAQQAVEKALKAVCVKNNIKFRLVHDIGELIETLSKNGIEIKDAIREATTMTEYAVEFRYPGTYEPLSENEYKKSIEIAEKVVKWANHLSK